MAKHPIKIASAGAFTLIEVLVALVILAIALTAVLETTQTSIQHSARASHALTAHWVAMDVMSKLQLHLLPCPSHGTLLMQHRYWDWKAQRDQASHAGFTRVAVRVSYNGKHYPPLLGFVQP